MFEEMCRYEMQMVYASIGWSLGATLGYAQASSSNGRVVLCIGDGSFQVSLSFNVFHYPINFVK